MPRSWTPSIVPTGHNQTVYLVLDDFGPLGGQIMNNDFFNPIGKRGQGSSKPLNLTRR